MTQVSKRELGKQLEGEIYNFFWLTIAKMTDKGEISTFFGEFFTRNEKVNFTKRLAIIVLIHKGYNWREIGDILKVSVGTIAKMANKIDSEAFKVFFKKLEKEEKWQKFWDDMLKSYLTISHPEKVAKLGAEGVERIYLGKKRRRLL